MFKSLKSRWHTLRSSPAGQRFTQHYEQRRTDRRHPLLSNAWVVLGALLSLIGIVLLVAPGPGIPLLLIGTCLMARESRGIAQRLDRTELSLRGLAQRCTRRRASFKP